MNATMQDTLLELFQQVSENPDRMPAVPIDGWPQDSEQRRLLTGFRNMLDRIQQRHQEKLEMQDRFSLAVQGANDGLWVQYLQTNEAYFSSRWKSMLGYEGHEISDTVEEWLSRLHPDDVGRVLAAGQAKFESEVETYGIEYRLRHKDGTYRWVLSRAAIERDAQGQPYRLAGSNTDITERKQAEEQLREKEAQYRSIFEATTDALGILDLEDGHVVEANPAACKMYGYSYEEFIGLPPSAYLSPERLPAFLENALPLIKAGGKRHTQGVNLRKDGSTFFVDVHQTAFTYQGKRHMLVVVRDITEQVRAEQELREKEEQYRSIFDATTDAIIINNFDGFVVEANSEACRMLGYSYEEFIGLHYTCFVRHDLHPFVVENLRKVEAGGQLETQTVCIRKDGSTIYTELHGTQFTFRGKPHILSAARDITELKRAEAQLREREEQYRNVFEATSDGLFITDFEDGHLVEVNPAACEMHGYSYQEFIALHPTAFIHPDYHHLFIEYLQTVKAGGQFHAQAIDVQKDGTTFPVEVHGTTFIYKGKPHILGVVRDITEHVQAEEQLREKEAQYRAIFEASTDGLEILDFDGYIVEANPAACKMYGYSYDEMIGLHASALTSPEYLPLLAEALQVIQAGGQFQTQGLSLRKDGTFFQGDARGTPFTYKGKPHILGIVRDITERVQAEEQLREKEEQYRGIFEASNDGLIIRNMEGVVVEANPAACKMHGYTYEEYRSLPRSVLIHPDYLSLLTEIIQSVQVGRSIQGRVVDLRKDGSAFPIEFRSDPFMYRGQLHMLTVLRDITEQVRAEEQLREREAQYRSIFEATTDGLFIFDLGNGQLVEVNPAGCQMHGLTYEEFLTPNGPRNYIHPDARPAFNQFLQLIKEGKAFQAQTVSSRKDGTVFPIEIHGTGFMYRGKLHGMAVIRDITEQVQAQQLLEQRVEARTRELSTLLEISHNVASTLQLKPLLGLILDQLKTVVDYSGASILTVEDEEVVIVENRRPYLPEQLLRVRFPLKQLGVVWEMLSHQESVIIDDVRGDSSLAQVFREAVGELMDSVFINTHAFMGIPLTLKERVIGMLVVTSREPYYFTRRHATLALAVANQAAVAIENARLYERAQELAALEERQKLARELHDSVSQALYGISLGAHAARTALDRDPSQLAEPLDYVLSLAEAALAEMRALIFELRPESLETEGLVSALTKQASSLHARHSIVVSTDLCNEPELPLKVKQELYRIAQEALHNTVKHAHARQVDLRLEVIPKGVILEVRDDGVGFDSSASFPGHLGLHSMRERVANLGGTFEIESTPGDGTRITVRIPGGL